MNLKQEIAQLAVDMIVDDLTGRSGLQNAWEEIDDDIRDEIVDKWRKIIETAMDGYSKR